MPSCTPDSIMGLFLIHARMQITFALHESVQLRLRFGDIPVGILASDLAPLPLSPESSYFIVVAGLGRRDPRSRAATVRKRLLSS